MQRHGEMPAAPVLRVEFGAPVAGQQIGVFQAGPLRGKQQEELVVVMIIVRQRQDRRRCAKSVTQ